MRDQASLFDDETAGDNALVRVGVVGSQKILSRAQKTFNRLTAKIEDQRRRLAEWQAFARSFSSRVAAEMEPLERRMDEQRRALLKCLDAAHDGGKLTRREQDKAARIIRERAAELLGGGSDPELTALHDKYSDIPHDDLRRDEVEAMKAMTEAALGMSFEDDEIGTPDDLIEAVQRRIDQGAAQDARGGPDAPGATDRQADRAQAGHAQAGHAQASRGKPASAKAAARLERELAAAEGATRSVREVYRKLASALHPDREPDPAERDRKTALMQRANQAYEAKDLLQLLALQIEVEQIDLEQLAAIGDDRLVHYNRVLEEQSKELDQEIEDVMSPFVMSLAWRAYGNLTPAVVVTAFQQDVAELRRESVWMAQQLDAFKDVRLLKAWLKAQRIERVPSSDSFDPFDVLESLMAGMPEDIEFVVEPPRRRRGQRKKGRG